jgi:SAM-dependent methyltransferase
MVVEHLKDPERQFREVRRVLRPGGLLLLHTPNALGYPTMLSRMAPDALKRVLIRVLDSRRPEDVFPAYYRANTDRRLAAVGGNAGFAMARVEMVASDAMFAVVPPLAAIELLVLRCLLAPSVRRYRSSIIAVLQKTDTPARSDSRERSASIDASPCASNRLGVISG